MKFWSRLIAIISLCTLLKSRTVQVEARGSNEAPKETWVLVLSIVGIIFLLCLSGTISGLNLAILSLDLTDLKVLSNAGSGDEKEHARKILPVRNRSNYVLCAFSVAEVAVDSGNTVLIESLTNSWIAILISTILITIFAGILPQAICHRHALVIGARTIWLTYIIMIITFLLAYPISLLLDCLIGEEISQFHDRKYLSSYIEMTKKDNALGNVELAAVTGALALKAKKVSEVMTPIKDVLMLPSTAVIDQTTLMNVLHSGYSRVPIYDGRRDNITGVLHVKELAAVLIFEMNNKNIASSNKVNIKYIIDQVKRELIFVSADASLGKDNLINQFKRGLHLAFVVNGNSHPLSKKPVIGIITLEDLIEEILQTEIVDETDTVSDNRKKEKRARIYTREIINALQKHKDSIIKGKQ